MIHSYVDIVREIEKLHKNNQAVVLVTGVFDVLHEEHRLFLTKAKQQGDVLVVGLESDVRVSSLKGLNRPINHIRKRLDQIDAFPFVDSVFELPVVSDWLLFMKQTNPNIYCVSSQSPFMENKKFVCQQVGVELRVVHQHNPQVSSTQMIKKNLHQERE